MCFFPGGPWSIQSADSVCFFRLSKAGNFFVACVRGFVKNTESCGWHFEDTDSPLPVMTTVMISVMILVLERF